MSGTGTVECMGGALYTTPLMGFFVCHAMASSCRDFPSQRADHPSSPPATRIPLPGSVCLLSHQRPNVGNTRRRARIVISRGPMQPARKAAWRLRQQMGDRIVQIAADLDAGGLPAERFVALALLHTTAI